MTVGVMDASEERAWHVCAALQSNCSLLCVTLEASLKSFS